MRYGLTRAANELQAEIERFNIIVDLKAGIVGWGEKVMEVPEGTSRIISRRYIRSFVKQARLAEAEKLLEKQVTLL